MEVRSQCYSIVPKFTLLNMNFSYCIKIWQIEWQAWEADITETSETDEAAGLLELVVENGNENEAAGKENLKGSGGERLLSTRRRLRVGVHLPNDGMTFGKICVL